MEIDKELRQSIELLVYKHEDFSDFFYTYLFEKHPELENLFENSSILEQKKELYLGIRTILQSLDEIDRLIPFLHDLGLRHHCYGVKVEYYPYAQEAMLGSLKVIHQNKWNEKLSIKWEAIIKMFIKYMIEGASRADKVV